MEYSNPDIPEGINNTKEHPLKEFLFLSAGIVGAIVVVALMLSLSAETLAPLVPFPMEKRLAANFISETKSNSASENYLHQLTDKISREMNLADDMDITLHYVEDDIQNAFATLGGHIYIHRGLIEIMPNENALSMVIAHEIAHVQHRHPLIAMGRGVVIGLFLAAASGINGDRLVSHMVNKAGVITVLGFSRAQEREADRSALLALEKHYGHVNGASDLFKAILDGEDKQILQLPQFMNTHPLSQERINAITQYAQENIQNSTSPVSALPVWLAKE